MMRIRTQKGFSTIELMAAMVIFGVITMSIATLLINSKSVAVKLSKGVDAAIETNFGERVILEDLRDISPSFNFVNQTDDSNLNFFEYIPDVSATTLQKATRIKTLKNGNSDSIIFLRSDFSVAPTILYDPPAAYDIGAAPDDFNQSATLTYRGINNQNWVSNQTPSGTWTEGRLFLLDTPALLRPKPSSGSSTDMRIPPRSPAFLGIVRGNDLGLPAELASSTVHTDPLSGASINDADTFLRKLPAVGGGQNIVRIRPVRLVKYWISPGDSTNGGKLFRSQFITGTFTPPFEVASGVTSVEFVRDNITNRSVKYKIKTKFSKSVSSSVN